MVVNQAKSVAASSTESDHVALSECTQRSWNYRNELKEFGEETLPPIAYEDNQACILCVNAKDKTS